MSQVPLPHVWGGHWHAQSVSGDWSQQVLPLKLKSWNSHIAEGGFEILLLMWEQPSHFIFRYYMLWMGFINSSPFDCRYWAKWLVRKMNLLGWAIWVWSIHHLSSGREEVRGKILCSLQWNKIDGWQVCDAKHMANMLDPFEQFQEKWNDVPREVEWCASGQYILPSARLVVCQMLLLLYIYMYIQGLVLSCAATNWLQPASYLWSWH